MKNSLQRNLWTELTLILSWKSQFISLSRRKANCYLSKWIKNLSYSKMSIIVRLIFDIKCCDIFNLVICNQAYFKYACMHAIQVSDRMSKYISTIPVMFPKFLWLTLRQFVQLIQIFWFSVPKNSEMPQFWKHSTYA